MHRSTRHRERREGSSEETVVKTIATLWEGEKVKGG